MNILKFLKWITPPILLDFYSNYHRGLKFRYFWEGIYLHYRDVPVTKNPFEGDSWAQVNRKHLNQTLALYQNGMAPVSTEDSLLLMLAALIGHQTRQIRILDFGGALGIPYVHLKKSLPESYSIEYYVVETQKMCEEGRSIYQADNHIHFLNSATFLSSTDQLAIDIIYINSVLQYIENYSDLLTLLASYCPQFFLFTRLSSSNIPTYATAQKNYKGVSLPYWFIAHREVVELMANHGYSLLFKSALEREYNQDNFPPPYRLGHACNLLFMRGE